MKKAIALIAAIVSSAAFANDMTEACAGNAPSNTEYWNDPKLHADNFCALWLYERHKALRQLNLALKTNRDHNNASRIYFNPKNHPNAEHIQLRRPWMEGRDVQFIDEAGVVPYRHYVGVRYVCVDNRDCAEVAIIRQWWELPRGDAERHREYYSNTRVYFNDARFRVNKYFPNVSEVKECVEAMLDRMEHQDYNHHSVSSACGAVVCDDGDCGIED